MGGSRAAWVELLRADRTRVVEGEASLSLEGQWLSVQRGAGPPLLFQYATILSIEWVEGDVELSLDSGHLLRLTRLSDGWTLAEEILRCRQAALVAHQCLPGRVRVARVQGLCQWADGEGTHEDQAVVLGEHGHLFLYPSRLAPFALPFCRVESSRAEGRCWQISASTRVTEIALECAEESAPELALLVRHADGLRARADALVRDRVGAEVASRLLEAQALGRSVTAAETDSAQPGLWEHLLSLVTPPAEHGYASLLRLAATEGGLRLGLAPRFGEPDALSVWMLAPCRTRRSRRPVVLGHFVGYAGEVAAATFCWQIPQSELSHRDDSSAELDLALAVEDLCDRLDEAVLLLDGDPSPLLLRESELGEWGAQGSWLAPFHHLDPLREARRLLECAIPEDDPDQWSRDLLERLSR